MLGHTHELSTEYMAAWLAADVMGASTLLIACTDASSGGHQISGVEAAGYESSSSEGALR
jgi:isocitrate lyase